MNEVKFRNIDKIMCYQKNLIIHLFGDRHLGITLTKFRSRKENEK